MIPMTPRRSHCHWGRWIFRCVGVRLKRDFEEPRVLRCNGTVEVQPREDVWYNAARLAKSAGDSEEQGLSSWRLEHASCTPVCTWTKTSTEVLEYCRSICASNGESRCYLYYLQATFLYASETEHAHLFVYGIVSTCSCVFKWATQ